MVDLDPEIWNNKTLGSAATNGFADEMELQATEDAAAAREGREPWIARRIHRYPGSQNHVSIESSYDDGMRLVDPATEQDNFGMSEPVEIVEPVSAKTAFNDESLGDPPNPDFSTGA